MVCRRWLGPLLASLLLLACAPRSPPEIAPPPFHLSEIAEQGDAQRRASTRLILDGLDFDRQGRRAQARSQYQLALQLDPGNPYAYLAFARHFAESTQPDRAFSYLEKLDGLLSLEEVPGGLEAHRLGVWGTALRASGRYEEGQALLRRAAELSPLPWEDGHLSAEELL